MRKTIIGPRLRQLRRENKQTQAAMAKALGVSTSYVNLLENNQRSLSVKLLMALSDVYSVDWHDLINDKTSNLLPQLRNMFRDPVFGNHPPDVQELRAALDHAPRFVELVLGLYQNHRATLERMMRLGSERMPDGFVASTPETVIHDFFRDHSNYFEPLEQAAETLRKGEACDTDEVYVMLKARLQNRHGIRVQTASVEDMREALRFYDTDAGILQLSEVLDHQNRAFQLAHVLGLVECANVLHALTSNFETNSEAGIARCHVELANYFAAAVLMPYQQFFSAAEATSYDIDRLVAIFGVSFEQVCHRLTTLQRDGSRGVPFFFLRVDKAGNVSKRFNSTSFNLAEYGGACPVWNIHSAFTVPGRMFPQFVELPDGDKFFTISRTADRPAINRDTQDHRLALALGCELRHAHRLGYAARFNRDDERLFSPIGINCHLCPRQACPQRAHRPLFIELPIDTNRRGNTRYES
jgi:predicted transcriptional regulator/transcriptional regulator with XRE-family HTH domain